MTLVLTILAIIILTACVISNGNEYSASFGKVGIITKNGTHFRFNTEEEAQTFCHKHGFTSVKTYQCK